MQAVLPMAKLQVKAKAEVKAEVNLLNGLHKVVPSAISLVILSFARMHPYSRMP